MHASLRMSVCALVHASMWCTPKCCSHDCRWPVKKFLSNLQNKLQAHSEKLTSVENCIFQQSCNITEVDSEVGQFSFSMDFITPIVVNRFSLTAFVATIPPSCTSPSWHLLALPSPYQWVSCEQILEYHVISPVFQRLLLSVIFSLYFFFLFFSPPLFWMLWFMAKQHYLGTMVYWWCQCGATTLYDTATRDGGREGCVCVGGGTRLSESWNDITM